MTSTGEVQQAYCDVVAELNDMSRRQVLWELLARRLMTDHLGMSPDDVDGTLRLMGLADEKPPTGDVEF